MIHNINNLSQFGLVPDMPFSEIPLNAWTRAQNVRFINGAVEKMTGQFEVYTSPVVAPYWLLQCPSHFWLYAGLTGVGATDGTSHADITRAAGVYTGTDLNGWTGTVIEGIPVISNNADVPQMWSPPALATDLIALTAWPATYFCKALRSIKRYLVALNVTKGAVNHPYLVKWSDQAPSNAVPASWDETDATIDAAEFSLPSDGGEIQDMIPLRDTGIIYKESQTWRMSYVAGAEIFKFEKVFDSIGAINSRCAAEFFSGKHVVYTGDDIVLHDGSQAKSLLDEKAKSLLTDNVDTDRYNQAYVTVDYKNREVWTCFVESGYTLPSKAIIWNWVKDNITVRELPNAAYIVAGTVTPDADLWSSSATGWDTDTGYWLDGQDNPNERRILMASPSDTKLFIGDHTQQFNGSNMTAFVERTSLGFPLKKDSPPDFTTEKLLKGIWPRITGTTGGVVNVYIGTQDVPGGAVTWQVAMPFTIGTTEWLDPMATGRLHAVKFESTGNLTWRLNGYDVDVVSIGSR